MTNYRERVPISGLMRAVLSLIGVAALALAILFALAGTWGFAAISVGMALLCLYRAGRGFHTALRDDGEP
jgi:hypothetical protein